MKTIYKYAVAATLAGALALAAVTPGQARGGRNAAIIGFGAGALVGAAVASNYGYYGPAYGPSYGYAPGYYAQPGYAQPGYAQPSYAYEPEPVYVAPPRRNYRNSYGSNSGCWVATDTSRGYGYYGAC